MMPLSFASKLIRAALDLKLGPIPKYGSAAFEALPADDIRRSASIVMAAEAWRLYCSEEQVTEDLQRQVEQLRRMYLADLLESYQAGLGGLAIASKDVSAAGDWPTAARAVTEADRAREHRRRMLGPRDNDFPGGDAA